MRKRGKQAPTRAEEQAGIQVAEMLCRLFSLLNEKIEPALAFPTVLDMVYEGLTDANVETFASAILLSSDPDMPSREVH